MSTRDKAYSIFEQLSETELQGFIALFSRAFPPREDDLDERMESFEKMEKICRYIPDLDERRILDEYREEKYGK